MLYFDENTGNSNINLDDTKMILKLSFLSDFWFGILNLKNAKHLKK